MIQLKSTSQKRGSRPDLTRSDTVWAVISILSFPIVALSLAALGWQSITSFIMACLAMLAVLLVEALASGRVWIFNPRYRHIFDHQDTPFRILVVAGGVLLLLETFLILEFLQNPAMDGFFLNVIAKKQCGKTDSIVAQTICPLYQETATSLNRRHDFNLLYSLQDAAQKHLIPSSLAGSCTIIPLTALTEASALTDLKFFAYCRAWQESACQTSGPAVSAFVTTSLQRDDAGFYTPLSWQEDKQSVNYQHLISNQDFMAYLDQDLKRRCEDWHGEPIMPRDLKPVN